MSLSHSEIDLVEDQNFQRKVWSLQHLGWLALAALVAAALFGLTGASPFTSHRQNSGGLEVFSPRFARQGTVFDLQLSIPSVTPELSVSREYLEMNEIVSVRPQPVGQSSDLSSSHFRFAPSANGEPITVQVFIRPLEAGRMHANVQSGAQKIAFQQWVFY